MRNRMTEYTIHSEKCKVCGCPANPGVTFTFQERGDNPTHLQGCFYTETWCDEHIPEDKKQFLKHELESWKETLQSPPGT